MIQTNPTRSINSLPSIDLKNYIIPKKLLNIIPADVALKFLAVFFDEDETTLKLAVGQPDKLKKDFHFALDRISKKLGKQITLYQSDAFNIKTAIQRSSVHEPLPKTSPTTTSTIRSSQPSLSPKSQTPFLPSAQPPWPIVKPSEIAKAEPDKNLAEKLSAPPLKKVEPDLSHEVHSTKPSAAESEEKKIPVSSKLAKLPKLYIKGEIPAPIFSKIPLYFSQLHRIICIDFVPPNKYSFATIETKISETQVIADYIKKHNPVDINIYLADEREFGYLLQEYSRLSRALSKVESKKAETAKKSLFGKKFIFGEKKKPLKVKSDIDFDLEKSKESEPAFLLPKEVKLAKDVVKPDIQGNIVSSEKEKSGFSGILEKFSSFFTPHHPTIQALPESVLEAGPSIVEKRSSPKVELMGMEEGHEEKKETVSQSGPIANLSTTKAMEEKAESSPALAQVAAIENTPKEEESPDKAESQAKSANTKETAAKQDEKNRMPADENDLGKLLKEDVKSLDDLKKVVKENNIPKIVAATVSYAISENASDIHLEPFEDELLVRYRIDGQLRNIIKLPPEMQAPLISRIKILSKLKLDESRVPQDGRFDVKFLSREVDLRVSTMPAVHGEKGVLRILDKSKGIISLESLGVEGDGFDRLIEAINKPYGIIMATGPTGSGKSTTLYAILARVATSNVNVITLEDPVEYEMKGVNQSQINPKIGYTFADGLRSILRQDPNIIMVGEVRDGETANMATQAALTGHLVLTTLHTNDASGALPRLINMGIEPFLITSSINAIIGQRLVRKVCSFCKEAVNLPDGVIKEVEEEIAKISPNNKKDHERVKRPFVFYNGKGCDKCNNTGYSGRLGVYEILPMTEAIEELTIGHATANQLLDKSKEEGMITMKQDGILKVLAGITTLDEVLRETSNK